MRNLIILIFFSFLINSCSQFNDDNYVENCADDSFSKVTQRMSEKMENNANFIFDYVIKNYETKIEKIKSSNTPWMCEDSLRDANHVSDRIKDCRTNPISSWMCPDDEFNYWGTCITSDELVESNISTLEFILEEHKNDIESLNKDREIILSFQKDLTRTKVQNKLKNNYDAYEILTKRQSYNNFMFSELSYENHFKDCVEELEKDPMTFNAKWK